MCSPLSPTSTRSLAARDRDANGTQAKGSRPEDHSSDADGEGRRADGTYPESSLEQRVYLQHDANFNVTSLVQDSDDTVVERYAYLPYGQSEVLTKAWGTQAFTAYGNPYRFQGLRLDAATGLHHARFRDYADWLGRWTQQDPAGWPDGVGRMEFVRSSPTAFRDPSGLSSEIAVDGASGGLFGYGTELWETDFTRSEYLETLDKLPKGKEFSPVRVALRKFYQDKQTATGKAYSQWFENRPERLAQKISPTYGKNPTGSSELANRHSRIMGRFGKVMVGAAVVIDAWQFYNASPQDRPRLVAESVGGLAGGIAGAQAGAAGGAAIGSLVPGAGTLVGAIAGGVIGGVVGGIGGSWLGGQLFDLGEYLFG